jgi:hypothetical protein
VAGTFVLYGSCEFSTNQRRNQAAGSVDRSATQRGLTARAYDAFPAGVVNTTINGNPGFTMAYQAPSSEVAQQCQVDAEAALASGNYEGFVAVQEI